MAIHGRHGKSRAALSWPRFTPSGQAAAEVEAQALLHQAVEVVPAEAPAEFLA
jgi:hypothetical protein